MEREREKNGMCHYLECKDNNFPKQWICFSLKNCLVSIIAEWKRDGNRFKWFEWVRIWHQHRHRMIACDGNDLIRLHLLDYTHSEPCVFEARCHATAPLLLHLYNLPHAHPIHHHQKNLTFRSLHFRCVYLLRCRGTKHFYYCHTGVLTRAIPIRTHSRINCETIRRPNRTKAKIKKNKEKKTFGQKEMHIL